jgi:cytochrome c oxidase subunit 2
MWLSGGDMMGISATGLSGKVVDDVFTYIVAICVFLLALITFLMVYFVIRYRQGKNPHPTNVEGNVWLELTWTIAPTLLVLSMFYYGLTGFEFLKSAPKGAMAVKVTARQWSWLFEYPNGIKDTVLRVSVGKPVKLLIHSEDVIHSFYVPAFRIKQDAVPGMQTSLWFQATEIGSFDVLCAQYCGLGHAHMQTKLIVLPEEEFTEWYRSKQTEGTAPGPPSGLHLYEVRGCVGCHSIDGSPRVGPTFKGLFGKKEIVVRHGKERTILVDEAYLRNYILHPNVDVVKGYPPVMPQIAMTDTELDAIIEWLETLK